MSPARKALYIDNSNIFRGCKKSGWRPSYRKIKDFLGEEEGEECDFNVHFFASEQEVPREKQARFYRALRSDLGFSLHTFKLAHRRVNCPACGREEWIPTEKGVDVGLVTCLMSDLINGEFDVAFVMSSDRDYMDAIVQVKKNGKDIKIIAWKWTVTPDTVQVCRNNGIDLIFLEDHKDAFEKPQGDVL